MLEKLFKKHFGIIIILVLSFIPVVPLFHTGLPLTHDGQDHVARIANFYLSLSEGNIIPRWAGNLNWGYGHPILTFLYPLPSYVSSLFHFLGFSFVDSFKLVMGMAFILSGITMYLWLNEFLGETAATIGSVLYNFAPYRFVDFYIRGDIGEQVAFIFPPLILFFMLKSSNNAESVTRLKQINSAYFAGISVSICALILAHNAMSLMFLPFITLYGVYLIYNSKNRKILAYQFMSALILGFGLAAFFWVPALLEGKYTLRDIVTKDEAFYHFVQIKDLFYGSWIYGLSGSFSVQLGLLQWIAVLAFLATAYKRFNKEKTSLILYLSVILYFLGSVFIMLSISTFVWKTFSILEKFQFPWRFLATAIFAAAVMGAIVVNKTSKKNQFILLLFSMLFILIFQWNYWQPIGYIIKPESFYSGVYNGTTDTGESAPIWSVRFMEKKPAAQAEVIGGQAKIDLTSRNSTHHKYRIIASTNSEIRENTLYFPNWTVYIDGVKDDQVQFQDPANRGLITYFITSGNHTVDVIFKDTKIRILSELISIVSAFIIIGLLIFPKRLYVTKN